MSNSTSKTVSIITPTYNCAATITSTIECVQNQTHQNIEHIIVDDGSTDNTKDIIEQHLLVDKRIKLVRSPHSGRSNARNKGSREAHGEYLLFLDADDTITSNYIEEMLAHQSGEHIIPACQWTVLNSGITSEFKHSPKIATPQFPLTVSTCPFVIHACLLKRKLFLNIGGFDEQLDHAEDWALWQRLARLNYEFVLVPKVLAHYNITSRTLDAKNAHQQFKAICHVIEKGYQRDESITNSSLPFYNGLQDNLKDKYIFLNWCWYVGIEASQNIEYSWLDNEAIALQNSIEKYEWRDASTMIISALQHSGAKENLLDNSSFPFLKTRLNLFFKQGEKFAATSGIEREIATFLSAQGSKNQILGVHVLKNNTLLKQAHAKSLVDAISFKYFDRSITSRVSLKETDFSINVFTGIIRFIRIKASTVKFIVNLPRLGVNTLLRFRYIRKNVLRKWVGEVLDYSISENVRTRCLELAISRKTNLDKANTASENTFDKIFSEENPWKYDSYYETLKYEQTIQVSNLSAEMNVVEIGCAEGHFTTRICNDVSTVVACDISSIALSRLEAKLKALAIGNVDTKVLDIREDKLQATYDLIFCSEILYYMGPIAQLKSVLENLVSQINQNGYFVHAHAFEASERTEMPGFGWRQEYGAAGIQKTLQSFPDLELEESITTDLYVIERYKKTNKQSTIKPIQSFKAIQWKKLEPDLSRQILKQGYICNPKQASKLLSNSITVFNYHSIGDDLANSLLSEYQVSESAFAQHLDTLRSYGFRSATPKELINLTRYGKPPTGKVVALTFDDAYEDFLTIAKPVLECYGFNALIFVPTSYVGKHADWDRRYGVTRKMLDWQQIKYLSDSGFSVGSHFTDHTDLTCLSTDELIEGFLDSKYLIEKHTGKSAIAVAYPYGLHQNAITRIAEYTGYEIGFTTSENVAMPYNNPMQISRFTILRQHDNRHIEGLLPKYKLPGKSYQLYKSTKLSLRKAINNFN